MSFRDEYDSKEGITEQEPDPQEGGTDGYEELADAIILAAVKDYRRALRALRRRPDSTRWEKVKRECEKFFRSGWFTVLTDADPEKMTDRLKKEARYEG